jgi:uncharacterized protein YgiM (DUF1202 family)
MVDIVEGELQVEKLRETPATASQPAFQPDQAKLDGAKVRAAMIEAAQRGEDPFKMTVGDLDKAGQPLPTQAPPTQAGTPAEIPEKFKKPNGEVDVEKLKASTERLDEAIQQKEAKLQEVQKSVDDYLKEYKAKESQLRNTPNPERLAAQLPPPPPSPMLNQPINDVQLEQMINADLQANPARTVAQLVKLAIAQELQPLNEDRRDNQIRENIKQIAAKDGRILREDVFAAVNAKLQSDPDLWKLKNPHKAAWLEVKEEMRLGEPDVQAQAQPSKPSAPILGGGTPPPAPSLSETRTSFQTLNAAIDVLSADPRSKKIDPNQQKALDQAAKEFFDAQERLRPR